MSSSAQGPEGASHRETSHDHRGRTRGHSPVEDHRSSHRANREKHPHRHPGYSSRSRSPRRYSRSRSRSRGREAGKRGGRSDTRSRSRSPKHAHDGSERRKRRRSRSRSASSSESSDGGHRKHKSRKSEKHKRRSSRSRERKNKKRDKKEKKKKGSVTSQWGQYGIISEADLYSREAEFRAWLVEECKINPETLSKSDTKKRFQSFVEDYNTATLPHEKFYNMQRYEARMSMLRNGEFVPQGDEDTYNPDADMQAHSNAHKRNVVEHESYLSKEQLTHLRRVQHERVEIAKRKQLGLEVKQSMGVRMDGSMFDD